MERTTDVNTAPPKISILLPSLNVAPFIEKCVESVCKQTLRDIEILCIDAGSTDGTEEKLRQFEQEDGRVKVIHSDQKSYGYQMNLGLQAARGEYIGIVETDDFAAEDMFEKLYEAASSHGAEVVKSNYYCHVQGKDSFFELLAGLPYQKVFHPKEHLSLLMRRPAIWTGIYKREFLEKNHILFLETPGASYQDTSFILKVWISAERVYLLRSAFLHYRMDNPNSSVKSVNKVFYVRDEMLSAHEFLEKRPEKKALYQGVMWDREATAYEWNYQHLADELKYTFLQGVQDRFKAGLSQNVYVREHLRWPVWKLVLETAENPLIYMRGRCDDSVFVQLMEDEKLPKPTEDVFQRWARRERSMKLPQTLSDVVNYAKNYGLAYCVREVSKSASG